MLPVCRRLGMGVRTWSPLAWGFLSRLYGAARTSLIGRGAREVAVAANFRQAQAMIDAVIGYAGAARGRPAPSYARLRRPSRRAGPVLEDGGSLTTP